jgi:uncharacterized protein (TIGR02444 family)
MSPVEMDSPLWRFSLAVYRGAGVQEECLDVQERFGVDVNLLMLCGYAGAVEGAVLSASDVEDVLKATGAWHADVVRGLRQVRRSLKPLSEAGDLAQVAGTLRLKVKAAELESEQIEQAMMWAWLRAHAGPWRQREPRQAVVANVFALLVRCGATGAQADPLRALPQFCAAALQAGT